MSSVVGTGGATPAASSYNPCLLATFAHACFSVCAGVAVRRRGGVRHVRRNSWPVLPTLVSTEVRAQRLENTATAACAPMVSFIKSTPLIFHAYYFVPTCFFLHVINPLSPSAAPERNTCFPLFFVC